MAKRTGLKARTSSIQAAIVAAGAAGTAEKKNAPTGRIAPETANEKPVGLSVRLTAETHEVLRRIAFERRVSIHSLLLEGVDFVIRKHG